MSTRALQLNLNTFKLSLNISFLRIFFNIMLWKRQLLNKHLTSTVTWVTLCHQSRTLFWLGTLACRGQFSWIINKIHTKVWAAFFSLQFRLWLGVQVELQWSFNFLLKNECYFWPNLYPNAASSKCLSNLCRLSSFSVIPSSSVEHITQIFFSHILFSLCPNFFIT